MPSMAELLREAGGQADATGQLLKGLALQPVSGLAGGGRALIDMLRGQGIDKSMQAGGTTPIAGGAAAGGQALINALREKENQ